MFVLDFFTVYPDSVSDKIILLNKKLLDKHYIGIIFVATILFCHQRIGCHGELMTSQIKIESQNFRCYNQPNIVSRFNSHTIQLERCSKTSLLCLYQFTMVNHGLPVPYIVPSTEYGYNLGPRLLNSLISTCKCYNSLTVAHDDICLFWHFQGD